MRTPTLSRPLLAALLLAGASLVACDKPEETATDTPPCTLAQLGDACGGNAACCSNNCQNSICVEKVGECGAHAPVRAPCSHPFECCSGMCDSIACVDPANPTCTQYVGDVCDQQTDCCTGVCGGEVGAQTCRPPEGQCLNLGDACGQSSQCCNSAVCDATTSKCVPPTAPSCKDTGACTDDSQCCSSVCGGAAGCTKLGGGVCRYPGEACATDSDCCSQNCPGAGTPGATCSSATCRQASQSCSDDAQCCSGICGFGSVCEPVPSGSTGATCATLGEACAVGTDCCSTNCQGATGGLRNGTCKPAASCNAPGDICVRAEDCCAGLCAQGAPGEPGRCDDASGGCGLDGYPCTTDSGCCTKKCVDLGTGAKVCQPSPGCRMVGNYCDRTSSCCGGTNEDDPSQPNLYGVFCNGIGTSPGAPEWDTNASQDSRTCERGQGCNPPGDVCGYKASQNCCYEGGGSGKAVCKPDSAGIMRCFGGPVNTTCPTGWDSDDPQCCIAAGDVCQFRDQCCGFAPCVPDASGVLRCAEMPGSCMPSGAICSTGAAPNPDPCCTGTTCREFEFGWACADVGTGTCAQETQACDNNPGGAPPCCFGPCTGGVCGPDCAPNGTTCTAASECCSGVCDGVCKAACVAETGTCTVDGDCCSGLTCDIPDGATSGTCSSGGVSTCAQTNLSCATDPCCNAADTCSASQICTPPAPPCAESGQLCTSGGGECCSGLTCSGLNVVEEQVDCSDPTNVSAACFCAPPLTCPGTEGAACSALVPCCENAQLYCGDKTAGNTCTSTVMDDCSCRPIG